VVNGVSNTDAPVSFLSILPTVDHAEDLSKMLNHNRKELQMMRLWRTHTSMTITTDGLKTKFLRDGLPFLASSHHCLLDTIFAMTALHQAHLTPDLAKPHTDLAISYRNRAIIALQSRMNAPSLKDSAVFHHCLSILGVTFIAYDAVSTSEASSQAPSSVLGRLAQLWRVSACIAELSNGLLVTRKTHGYYRNEQQPVCLRAPHQEEIFLLHEVSLLVEPCDVDDQEVLRELGTLFRHKEHQVHHILASLARLPRKYLSPGSRVRAPLPSALLMLYARLLQKRQSIWWVKDFGIQLAEEVFLAASIVGPTFAASLR
jgi:hypothetical protein